MKSRFFVLVPLVICVALVAGCNRGPKLFPAAGVVKYKGAAVPGADVIFVPAGEGTTAIGRSDEQGRFTLTTDGRSGALAGAYTVSITAARAKRAVSAAEAVTMSSEQIAANREDLVPIKYNNPITSGLTANVAADAAANEFAFDLK